MAVTWGSGRGYWLLTNGLIFYLLIVWPKIVVITDFKYIEFNNEAEKIQNILTFFVKLALSITD